jgi:WD40 repeat protein
LALASSSEDKTCRSFDVRSENQLAVYSPNTPNSGFTSIVFSVSGRYVIAGSDDSSVHIWDFFKTTHLGEYIFVIAWKPAFSSTTLHSLLFFNRPYVSKTA